MSNYKKFKQGTFTPRNREKFMGNTLPTYRSSFELKFMLWCDKNTNVIEWGSENVVIPYFSPIDNRTRMYFVDNYVKIVEGDKITRYLIEIKPYSQTVPPVVKPNSRKKKSSIIYEQYNYVTNQSKWKAARDFAEKKGYKFLILTENELFG